MARDHEKVNSLRSNSSNRKICLQWNLHGDSGQYYDPDSCVKGQVEVSNPTVTNYPRGFIQSQKGTLSPSHCGHWKLTENTRISPFSIKTATDIGYTSLDSYGRTGDTSFVDFSLHSEPAKLNAFYIWRRRVSKTHEKNIILNLVTKALQSWKVISVITFFRFFPGFGRFFGWNRRFSRQSDGENFFSLRKIFSPRNRNFWTAQFQSRNLSSTGFEPLQVLKVEMEVFLRPEITKRERKFFPQGNFISLGREISVPLNYNSIFPARGSNLCRSPWSLTGQ